MDILFLSLSMCINKNVGNSYNNILEYILILDSMLPHLNTLTSICEDTLNSADVDQNDLRPLNQLLINEEYLNKIPAQNDDQWDHSSLYNPTTNYKQFFRFSHLNVSHPARSSLWLNLLRQDKTHHQHKFQQAIERYPQDIRYVSIKTKRMRT